MRRFLNNIPVEIFHLIFRHLWAHEILYAFRNISDYVDGILSRYMNYSIDFESIQKSHFDLVCRYIRPEQVISLILSDKKETPNQSQLFRSLFSIEQFLHLRALKFLELDDDGESFISNWSKLQHLVSFQIDVKIDLPLMKNSPALQRLIINTPSGMHFDMDPALATIPLKQLRHLSLSNCSCAQLQQIFRQAARLTSLKINFTFLSMREIEAFANFHRQSTTITSLISLSLFIDGYTITCADLQQFLKPLRRLRRLEVVVRFVAESSFVDGYQWEMFILEHFPALKTFNFKFPCWNNDVLVDVIDPYRRPFWLDRHWYVACDPGQSRLFTIPHFIPSSMHDSVPPISPERTTLPIEQHHIFYDRVTDFIVDSDDCHLPYRYNNVIKLIVRSPYVHKNALDLSKVQSLIVNTSDWSFFKILALIKKRDACGKLSQFELYISRYAFEIFPNISLKQVRILSLPQYGDFEGPDPFPWSRLFPCIERLIVSINSKKQIPFFIDQFKTMLSGFFYMNIHRMDTDKPVRVTRQWIEKHTHRFRANKSSNFICQINSKYLFSVCLWIGEDEEGDENSQPNDNWWRQCLPRNSAK